MSTTRRGFLGMLGLAAAATSLPKMLSAEPDGALIEGKRQIVRTISYRTKEFIKADAEVYMTSAVMSLKPDQAGRIRQTI